MARLKRKNTRIIELQSLDRPLTDMKAILNGVGLKKTPMHNTQVVCYYPYDYSVGLYIDKYSVDSLAFRRSRKQVFQIIHYLMEKRVDIEFIEHEESMKMVEKLSRELYLKLVSYLLKIKGK